MTNRQAAKLPIGACRSAPQGQRAKMPSGIASKASSCEMGRKPGDVTIHAGGHMFAAMGDRAVNERVGWPVSR